MVQNTPLSVLLLSTDEALCARVAGILSSSDSIAFDLRCAGGVVEGLEMIAANPVSLVLCDTTLPELNHGDVFSEMNNCQPDIPVIMIQPQEDLQAALEYARAGAEECYSQTLLDQISLPVRLRIVVERRTQQSLYALAANVPQITSAKPSPATAVPKGFQAPAGKRILVTDDDASTRGIVRDVLESCGYIVEEAADGYSALALIRKRHLADTPFSLILVDLMMPKMDGFEFIHVIKLRKWSAHLPVVVLTSRGDKDAVLRCKEEQISGYVVKPVEREVLLDRIAQTLQLDSENTPAAIR